MEDPDSREGFGNFGWLGRSDDYAGSRNQGPMDVRNMIDGVASTGADVTRDAWRPAPQTDQSREQSQHALIVQAARATMDFQQLQWECEAPGATAVAHPVGVNLAESRRRSPENRSTGYDPARALRKSPCF